MEQQDLAASSSAAYALRTVLAQDLVGHIRSFIPPRPDESPRRLASLLSGLQYHNMLSGHLYEAAIRGSGGEGSSWTIFLLPEETRVEVMPEVDEQTGKPMVVLSGVYLMRGDGPDPMTIRTKLQARKGRLTREETQRVIGTEGDDGYGWGGYYGVLEDGFWGEYTVLGTGCKGMPEEVSKRLRERSARRVQKYDLGNEDDWW